MSRRIFIGDVHGHYDGLMQLLAAIAPTENDQVYFVGDLIDRGPASSQVVEYVRQHADGCVMGNHEQLLLSAFVGGQVNGTALQAWLHSGGQSTLASYDNIDLLTEHLTWLRKLPAYIDLGDVWLVHAGIDPQVPIAEQTFNEFCWVRDDFHNHPTPCFADKLVVTGHTITFTFPDVEPGQVVAGPGWLDIDTGAYHPKSGWLTGLDLDNEQVYQVNVYSKVQRQRSLPLATTPFSGSRQRVVRTVAS